MLDSSQSALGQSSKPPGDYAPYLAEFTSARSFEVDQTWLLRPSSQRPSPRERYVIGRWPESRTTLIRSAIGEGEAWPGGYEIILEVVRSTGDNAGARALDIEYASNGRRDLLTIPVGVSLCAAECPHLDLWSPMVDGAPWVAATRPVRLPLVEVRWSVVGQARGDARSSTGQTHGKYEGLPH
jgi:hypothetical protein